MRAPIIAVALLAAGCWNFDAALATCTSEGFPCLPMGASPDGGGQDAGPAGTWQSAYTLDTPLPLIAVHAASKDEVYFAGAEAAAVHYLNGTFTEGYFTGLQPHAIGFDSQGFIFVGESGGGVISRIDAGLEWAGGELTGTHENVGAIVTCVWNAGAQTLAGSDDGHVLKSPGWAASSGVPAEVSGVYGGWGSADNDFWIDTIDSSFNDFVYHFNGSWQPAIAVPSLNAIWGASPDDVWGAGPSGVVIRVHTDGGVDHLDAGKSTSWIGVWGSGPNDVFLAGNDGVIGHWDGAHFTRTQVSAFGLRDVHGTGPLDVWAVDTDGGIWHYGP